MSEPGHESTLRDFYRELLPTEDEPSADDSVRRVVDRARAQLAARDLLGFGFTGLVRVVLSLIVAISRHSHRQRARQAPPAQQPRIDTGAERHA